LSLFSVLNPTFHQVHAQDCPALCNILDVLPCSSAHGMFQARILQCVAIFSSRGSSKPRDQTQVCFVSCVASRSFTCGVTAAAKLLQSCPTLYDPMDCSLPGSPVPGILQARTLERVAQIQHSPISVLVNESPFLNNRISVNFLFFFFCSIEFSLFFF